MYMYMHQNLAGSKIAQKSVQDISSKMTRREFSIFIIFSDAYACTYVALKL